MKIEKGQVFIRRSVKRDWVYLEQRVQVTHVKDGMIKPATNIWSSNVLLDTIIEFKVLCDDKDWPGYDYYEWLTDLPVRVVKNPEHPEIWVSYELEKNTQNEE